MFFQVNIPVHCVQILPHCSDQIIIHGFRNIVLIQGGFQIRGVVPYFTEKNILFHTGIQCSRNGIFLLCISRIKGMESFLSDCPVPVSHQLRVSSLCQLNLFPIHVVHFREANICIVDHAEYVSGSCSHLTGHGKDFLLSVRQVVLLPAGDFVQVLIINLQAFTGLHEVPESIPGNGQYLRYQERCGTFPRCQDFPCPVQQCLGLGITVIFISFHTGINKQVFRLLHPFKIHIQTFQKLFGRLTQCSPGCLNIGNCLPDPLIILFPCLIGWIKILQLPFPFVRYL